MTINTRVIPAHNVNHAFTDVWHLLRVMGVQRASRNGPVLRMPGPVITEYLRPAERLLFNPVRDCNHVFHLMETIWMLAGQNNVDWLLPYNSNYLKYAEEENHEQWGAYGHRWLKHFDVDQLGQAVRLLREDPSDRRVVIQMWDPRTDLGAKVRDVPCNTNLYLEIDEGRLNMTICCRSNDVLWGAYGANVVHFSILQELIARAVNVDLGRMYQVSNNFHVYLEREQVSHFLDNPPVHGYDFYEQGLVQPYPLLQGDETIWDFCTDCYNFIHPAPGMDSTSFKCQFFHDVVMPLGAAYNLRKALPDSNWKQIVRNMPESDWKFAFQQWVDRREGEKQ